MRLTEAAIDDEERDLVAAESDDALGDDPGRDFRGANEDQVAASEAPEAVGHVFGHHDVAGEVHGGEHAGAVHLQDTGTKSPPLVLVRIVKRLGGVEDMAMAWLYGQRSRRRGSWL